LVRRPRLPGGDGIRHASSVMHMLLVQEGGANTENPDPKV